MSLLDFLQECNTSFRGTSVTKRLLILPICVIARSVIFATKNSITCIFESFAVGIRSLLSKMQSLLSNLRFWV